MRAFLNRVLKTVASGWSEGARDDRTTYGFRPAALGPNAIHDMDAASLRARARWLVESDPHAEACIDAIVSNVLECGIVPVPVDLPKETQLRVRGAWREWGGLTPKQTFKPADVTGQLTIYEIADLWFREYLIAGGCLTHYVELDRRGQAGAARVPLAIELISEERFANDADTMVGANPKTRTVRQGIEIDPATGAPVAYWVRKAEPNDLSGYDPTPIRLPAEHCVYAFQRRRSSQLRGVTHLARAVLRLWQLSDYTANEMTASQMKSQWGYVRTRAKDDGDFDDNLADDGDASDLWGNAHRVMGRGMIYETEPGGDIKGIFPNTPGSDSAAWLVFVERTIAFSVGLSRLALTRDASDANHSSLRAARQEDQRRFRRWQQTAINHFINPTWAHFNRAAARVGLDGWPSPLRFLRDPDLYLDITARAPGWASVSPLDDAQANEINLGLGLTSRAEIKAESGGEKDVTDTFRELEGEERDAAGKFPIHGFKVNAQEEGNDAKAAANADARQSAPSGQGGGR